MPVELLPFPPSYCVVGFYRLVTDDKLWYPIWLRSRKTLKRALIALPFYLLLAYPLTRLYVSFILARSPFSPANVQDAAYFGISVIGFTTWSLVLGQVSGLLEWALRREVAKGKKEVYDATVRSRGKDAAFWGPYVEEWKVPPIERAERFAQKQPFYAKLAGPIFRLVILKVLLTPLSFVPFLNTLVSAGLRSLSLARTIHQPYFSAKKMTPIQQSLFLVERLPSYRTFALLCALTERIPLLGLIFALSNPIGAAMWAHDLEKRQHAFAKGEIERTEVYVSKTALVENELPKEFVGGFPGVKSPLKIS